LAISRWRATSRWPCSSPKPPLAALAAGQKQRRVLALDVQGRSYFFDVVRER
jgi:hypothetical protein